MIETLQQSGGYVLGFKIEPAERLKDVAREIYRLHHVFSQSPNFGVTSNLQMVGQKQGALPMTVPGGAGSVEGEESEVIVPASATEEMNPGLAAYYADPTKNVDREPVYSLELGLAIEELREGVTLHSLWQV